MISKEDIDLETYDKLEKFTQKVLQNMKTDGIPTTPEYYKIYFQKTLAQENDYELRKHISKLNKRETKEETEKILEYEEKLDSIAKLNKEMLKNIQSTYKKNNYLIKFIQQSEKQSQSLVTPKAIHIFFKKLNSTISQIHNSLQKDMDVMKELYSKTLTLLKNIESNKIFDTKFHVYKKEYFLSKIKQEVEISKKLNFNSYLMVMKLDKTTSLQLKNILNNEKANKFFAKVIQSKFRKDDIIGYLDNGVFGIIFSNLNEKDVQKVAVKFSDILNHSSMYINDEYLELHPVIAIQKLKDEFYLQNINQALQLLDKAYNENISFLIDY